MALLVVTEAFSEFSTGHPEVYNPGRLVDSSDPVVRGRESSFEPADLVAARARGSETASAAPGESRTRTQPRRRAKKSTAKRTGETV